jgi:thiol-disulfide isomerase/thioredoxin
VQVDTNGDGNLADETAQVILPDSSIMVWVDRKWPNGIKLALPYTIKYSRAVNRANQIEEVFSWIAHYRAEGKLKVKGCESQFVVMDINGDGLFDNDSGRGLNIGLDRNGDERIWGSEEYLSSNQIIELCNDAFLVERIAPDGTSLTVARTSLRVPKIGEKLPTFVLTTLEGKPLRSDDLRGKVHLLDFWASWCQPCVEKFPLVKQLAEDFKDKLAIIAVNVDEESRIAMARQVIKAHQLPWLHVMSGRGETDPVWKMFGGMEGNRLSIPLYVLVDDKGELQYAGNGGKDLSELRVRLRALLKIN